MPIRANPAAAALLASGVSVSALILLIYLKLRNSNRRSLPGPEESRKSSTIVDKSFDTDQTPECVAETGKQKTILCEEDTEIASLPIPGSENSQIEAEAAEESVSECENHLEEESEEAEDILEEVIEPEVKLSEEFAPAHVTVAAMTTSTDALGDSATSNNNNDDVIAYKNEDIQQEATEAGLTVETDLKLDAAEAADFTVVQEDQAAPAVQKVADSTGGVGGEGDRVSNWLAKNEQFGRYPPLQDPHHSNSRQNYRPTCEEASDDSGRPSSVDTAADAASPRSAGTVAATARQSTAAVAAALSMSPLNIDDGSAVNHGLLPDRSKVIRGVSPVPGDDNDIIHQFLIPNKLGGSMVGTRGRNINYIRAKSGASVWISRNFFDKKTQVVNVRGPSECVKSALQVIKKRFPELDVKPINTAVPIQRNPALQPTMCQLSLPVGAQVDVNVCAMCRGTTVFLQQPTHPSFHHLEKMDYTIMKHYADQASVPALPRPVNPGAVCVAPFGAAWYRAIIADVYPEEDLVLMKYLDWGGYERMPVGCLKQIRTEMMHLPFQAVEGHLAYISPILSEDEDPETHLEQLSRTLHERYLSGQGKRVKAQVVYFNDVGQPCVYLYTKDPQSDSWRFLQEDLVQAGLAQWFQMPHLPPQIPLA